MRSDIVSYQEVCIKIDEMLSAGEKINVRNVRSRTGGASARIAEFIKRWYDEHSGFKQIAVNETISDALQQAIITDRNTFIIEMVQSYKNEINSLNILLQEVRGLLKDQEELTTGNIKEVEALKTKLIEANQRNVTYHELVDRLEDKLAQSIKAQNESTTESTKAFLQLERADSLNVELKQQIQGLQEQLTIVSVAKYSAEKEAAVWQSKYEQLAK